jgi:hypothetical protein
MTAMLLQADEFQLKVLIIAPQYRRFASTRPVAFHEIVIATGITARRMFPRSKI